MQFFLDTVYVFLKKDYPYIFTKLSSSWLKL